MQNTSIFLNVKLITFLSLLLLRFFFDLEDSNLKNVYVSP